MAVSQSQIDALDAAIATGAKSITFEGRTVAYNSTSDMIAARNHLQQLLNAQNGVMPTRQIRVYTEKGFGG